MGEKRKTHWEEMERGCCSCISVRHCLAYVAYQTVIEIREEVLHMYMSNVQTITCLEGGQFA